MNSIGEQQVRKNEFRPGEASPGRIIRANKSVRTLAIVVWIATMLIGAAAHPLAASAESAVRVETETTDGAADHADCLWAHLPQHPSAGRLSVPVRLPSGEVASDPPAGDLGCSQYESGRGQPGPTTRADRHGSGGAFVRHRSALRRLFPLSLGQSVLGPTTAAVGRIDAAAGGADDLDWHEFFVLQVDPRWYRLLMRTRRTLWCMMPVKFTMMLTLLQ